jgi:hypothetical protein
VDRDLIRAAVPPVFAACVVALLLGGLDAEAGPAPAPDAAATQRP